MHEVSICEGLIGAILAELDKLGPVPKKLLRVRVAVGGLRQVVPESLQFAYEAMTEKTAAKRVMSPA